MFYSYDKFEIEMTKNQAFSASHSGECYDDVKALCQDKKIKRQLKKISDTDLINTLQEWGAWEITELQDRSENEIKLIWITACNISEQIKEKN
jgi:hypothetical protein